MCQAAANDRLVYTLSVILQQLEKAISKPSSATASNYRPVSLTCVCCKMLEHIMYSSIVAHLDRHKILSEFQHGFRKQRSCETQLLLTIHD